MLGYTLRGSDCRHPCDSPRSYRMAQSSSDLIRTVSGISPLQRKHEWARDHARCLQAPWIGVKRLAWAWAWAWAWASALRCAPRELDFPFTT